MYDIYGKAKVTGNFGDKRSYYKPGKFHEGDDIALAMNSPINARAAGTIIGIKSDPNGYGNYVDIDHGNGIITRYAHANKFNVKPGQKVKEGEIIGLVGSTGRSSGPHLHTELIVNGIKQNPRELEKYMANVLKPKGTVGVPDIRGIEDLENEIATAQVGGRQLSPEEEELKKQSIAFFLNQLQKPVEMPKHTTLKDVLNAQKGQGLKTFADFLDNPQTMRTIGDFMPKFGYDPQSGKLRNVMEDKARQQEAIMQAEQQKALEQQKMQNNLAANAYGDILHQDIANMQDARARELAEQKQEWEAQQHALSREFEREENEKNRQNNLKIAKERSVNSGLTPTQETSIREKFMKDKAVQDYKLIEARTQDINAIKNAFKRSGRLNAQDQALIMNFNKVLDPISVVRESEFARTAAGQSLIDRAAGAWTKVVKGGSGLSKAERDAIYQVFDVMTDSARNRARTVAQEYNDLAIRYNANPRNIVMQYESLLDEEAPATSNKATKGGRAW